MKFRGPLPIIVLVPLLFLFLGSIRARHLYYRDPTSLFFDFQRAYDKGYSDIRQREANTFIEESNKQTSIRRKRPSSTSPLFCIGIPTISRPTGDVYIRTTIGSLLAGLSPTERDAIHLMPFIAHSDPSIHPIYEEPWLHNVADQILTYEFKEDLDGSQLQHVKEMETYTEISEKQVFDYAYMLEACLKVNASYIVTFEDDILALDGWFHRTKAALRDVDEQVKLLGLEDWFYLRLFYMEQFLGWNSEFWLYYLLNSLVITFVVLSVITLCLHRNQSLRGNRLQILGIATVYCALTIGDFFACGRVSMAPIPHGIQQMPKYACCAQGLALNQARVPRLIKWYHDRRLGYVDNLAEELADTGEVGTRWALTPSVIQHVGTFSTKGKDEDGDKFGDVGMSQQKWNFAFELNNATVLYLEHQYAIKKFNIL